MLNRFASHKMLQKSTKEPSTAPWKGTLTKRLSARLTWEAGQAWPSTAESERVFFRPTVSESLPHIVSLPLQLATRRGVGPVGDAAPRLRPALPEVGGPPAWSARLVGGLPVHARAARTSDAVAPVPGLQPQAGRRVSAQAPPGAGRPRPPGSARSAAGAARPRPPESAAGAARPRPPGGGCGSANAAPPATASSPTGSTCSGGHRECVPARGCRRPGTAQVCGSARRTLRSRRAGVHPRWHRRPRRRRRSFARR
mmetsp:Transcript_79569/g.215395  ORF Transcript_79569/g.215395 Transcript_79569/m.215395 type:complete len:255 (-) Transcript_79569:826-1590(-)